MTQVRVNVQEIRERLQREREETLTNIARLREGMTYDLETSPEEGDPDIWEREKIASLIRSLENKLSEIDRALRMTQRGDYGLCERCGQPIDPARLKVMPTATLCLKCKQELERQAAARISRE
ncbi:MAG: TraR/DksA C4-type zinc finger protein [Anaerolineae bacterium]|nr:TraR/DksA C4-type zinc finger protein [Anaerolineae bacterium]